MKDNTRAEDQRSSDGSWLNICVAEKKELPWWRNGYIIKKLITGQCWVSSNNNGLLVIIVIYFITTTVLKTTHPPPHFLSESNKNHWPLPLVIQTEPSTPGSRLDYWNDTWSLNNFCYKNAGVFSLN